MKGKNLDIAVLFDFYGEMLTDKQKDVIDLYYNEDLSLSEIAEQYDITRQGVRDNIKRGEQYLLELEEKLRFVERHRSLEELLFIIEHDMNLLREINKRDIYDKRVEQIAANVLSCIDEYRTKEEGDDE